MRSTAVVLGTVLAVLAASAVDAAPRKRVVAAQRAYQAPPTVFVSRGEDGRTRTRLIVQQRSYLDGGTEVLPGQRKYHDYAYPPYFSAFDILGPGKGNDRHPLNPRWELGGGPRL